MIAFEVGNTFTLNGQTFKIEGIYNRTDGKGYELWVSNEHGQYNVLFNGEEFGELIELDM